MDVEDGVLTIQLSSTEIKVGVSVDVLVGYLNGDYDMSRPIELMKLSRRGMQSTSNTVFMNGTFEANGGIHRATIEVNVAEYNACDYYCEFDNSYVSSIS